MRFIGWYPLNFLHFCIVMVSCCFHFIHTCTCICSHFCKLQSDVSLFYATVIYIYIHVSRCPFSDIIYRKTKSKLFLSKMLKDSYYLANSYKNFPFLVLRKIKNDFRFGSNINFTAGWPQTYNVQLIKAGVCRLNKITLYKV